MMEEFKMLLEKVAEIIASELSVSKEDITMDTHLQNDLNADSLDAVELIMTIEEEFDLQIPDEAAQELKTVGNIVEYLEKNQ
jgi:acyl carrier protein